MNNEIQTTENITVQKPVKSGSGKLSIVLMLIMSAMLIALQQQSTAFLKLPTVWARILQK